MRLDPAERPPLQELEAVDLIVLGSGAAGLSAALTATIEGLSVAVLEVAPVFGGTTARSSGTVWVPDSRAMRAAGFPPDRVAAQRYLRRLIGDETPSAQWERFLELAPVMQADLEDRASIRFRPYLEAPDYRSDFEGAALGGRPLEPLLFDGRELGGWFELLAQPIRELTVFGGMMLTRAEAQRLIRAERSPHALVEGARLVVRHLCDRTRYPRGTRLVMGNALVARMLHAILVRGGLAWQSVNVQEIWMQEGRASGVSGQIAGVPFTLQARRGVVLAGGGFPADPALRAKYLPEPLAEHTPASAYARGTSIALGLAAGGQLGPEAGSNALWFPSSLWERPGSGAAVWPHIALDRAKPGSLIVDRTGRRFTNEAVSYHDFCTAVYARGAEAVPCWLVAGRGFIRRYGLGVIRPRTVSLRAYLDSGYLMTGRDAEELASVIGVPPGALAETIAGFNRAARREGADPFGRGGTAYERSNGDNSRGLANPCIAEIGTGRLYAVALWPTPLATARGLVCGPSGEVLEAGGKAIAGLYAAGNDMQSVFAGRYPGAGAQIGPAMTFGWAAARHAAGKMYRI